MIREQETEGGRWPVGGGVGGERREERGGRREINNLQAKSETPEQTSEVGKRERKREITGIKLFFY